MNPTTEIVFLEFDKTIADIIFTSAPPNNVTVSKPEVFTKASADVGGGFYQVAIQFANDIHDLAIGFLAAWLYECCKQSGKKKGRVNGDEIIFNKRNMRRLIKMELKQQRQRDAQRRREKNRAAKKRA